MNTVTHALLPVISAVSCEGVSRVFTRRKSSLSSKQLLVIGVFGAAPDLLNPHLSLEARYSSWSHTIWFWLLLTAVIFAVYFLKRNVASVYLTAWLSFSYVLHLVLDALSGGIAWNYPLCQDTIGHYYINPIWWIPVDIILFIIVYFLFRARPKI